MTELFVGISIAFMLQELVNEMVDEDVKLMQKNPEA